MHSALPSALRLCNATKAFGASVIFKDLTIEFEAGSIVILLGANGAGKSTLLRVLAGLTRLDSGSVEYPNLARRGYLAHDLHLYSSLTVLENLCFFASICAVLLDVRTYIEDWKLSALINKRISELSKGQQARVALARSMIANPQFLFLDEPSSALDDLAVDLLSEKIINHRDRNPEGCTIIATHDMNRLARLGNRAIVFHGGKVAYDSRSVSTKDFNFELTLSYYRGINR